jgi:LmbE family N-acetylglucosaminyl deacetylase
MNSDTLPRWRSVLAVVAHPDDESFALGAVLSAFADSGTAVWVLCLTQGVASTLHGVPGDLGVLRQQELSDAADALGVTGVVLRRIPPDGYYRLDRMLSAVPRNGGRVLCCGTCMDARGIGEDMLIEDAHRSTMEELATLTLAAEKVLVF